MSASLPYLFLHVPKTAGTSFRQAVERVFPGRVAYDYGPKAGATTPFVRELVHERHDLEALRVRLIDEGMVMLGGHVSYARYRAIFPVERVLTFFREPIARIVSEHQHVRRLYGFEGTLRDFAARPRNQNLQLGMLRGAPLDRIAFFGITERYDDSLDLLARRVGWSLPALESNRNPEQPRLGGAYELPADTDAWLRERNLADLSFYQGALRLFDEQRLGRAAMADGTAADREPDAAPEREGEGALDATSTAEGDDDSCSVITARAAGLDSKATSGAAPGESGQTRGVLGRYEAGKIVGWATIVGSAEPVRVQVAVDGKALGSFVASLPRPDLRAKGLHPTGQAGFEIVVGELAPGTTVRCIVETTGRELVNSPLVVR